VARSDKNPAILLLFLLLLLNNGHQYNASDCLVFQLERIRIMKKGPFLHFFIMIIIERILLQTRSVCRDSG